MEKNTKEVPDKILDRIKKLYDKALSSRSIGSIQEAESFMLGVQKLLAEYQLEMSILEGESSGKKTDITETTINYKKLVSYGDWEADLMTVICRYNWCKCIYNTGKKTITIIGRGENIDVCNYLYNFITVNLVVLSKQSFYTKLAELNKSLGTIGDYCLERNIETISAFEKHLNDRGILPYRRYYIRDYLAGAVEGIRIKLYNQQQEQRRNSGINSLVLFNDEKIKDYLKQFHPNLKIVKPKEKNHREEYYKGRQDALNLNIGEALGEQKKEVVAELK